MLFCPSAETSQADNRTDDFEHWDFARKLLHIPSFTIFVILIVKNKNGTTLQIQRSQKKKYEYIYIQCKCTECKHGDCVNCRIADVPASVLFPLIFPSQLTQFNSCKTRVQLWENVCPLCAPISSVHIWVQIPAWIMQLPPTWTLLIPVCLTTVEMTRSTAWILNGVVTLISKWTRSTCCLQ